jgi:hypothetical protein
MYNNLILDKTTGTFVSYATILKTPHNIRQSIFIKYLLFSVWSLRLIIQFLTRKEKLFLRRVSKKISLIMDIFIHTLCVTPLTKNPDLSPIKRYYISTRLHILNSIYKSGGESFIFDGITKQYSKKIDSTKYLSGSYSDLLCRSKRISLLLIKELFDRNLKKYILKYINFMVKQCSPQDQHKMWPRLEKYIEVISSDKKIMAGLFEIILNNRGRKSYLFNKMLHQ